MKKLLLIVLLASACASQNVALDGSARTDALRARFVPGKATRAEVMQRAGGHPEISLARPSTGWEHAFIRDVEDKSGLIVARAEKYVSEAATSMYFTLEHVWYFYDRFDVLVDVQWQRMGD